MANTYKLECLKLANAIASTRADEAPEKTVERAKAYFEFVDKDDEQAQAAPVTN